MNPANITDIATYLARHADEIGDRILSSYPALYGADEAPSPLLSRMVRVPYPAQTLAIMEQAMAAAGGQSYEKLAVPLWWHFHLVRQFVAIFSSHGVPESHLM